MKPPYLNKLSKKQLKKEYTRQWREAIRANGEIYKANRTIDQLHELVHQQEEEINVKSIALTEHFGMIENLKEELADTQEALRRSRNLRQTYQDLADRHTGERASIEDMAENLYDFMHEILQDTYMEWQSLDQDCKDYFRVKVTHIISHKPTYGKEGTTSDERPTE